LSSLIKCRLTFDC